MKLLTLIEHVIVCLAVVGVCSPQLALAADPNQPTITDVRLHEGGILYGQVLSSENTAISGADVVLRAGGRDLAVVKSDKEGRFSFVGLQNGVYQIRAINGERTYRVWTAEAAPPAAQPQVTLVTGTVRGQQGMMAFRNLMANPFVVAGIIATAVAIPVAIHNAKKPASP